MSEYLKMADAFVDSVVNDADCLLNEDLGEIADFSGYKKQCRYAAHAINSHDALVAQRDELLDALESLLRSSVMSVSHSEYVAVFDEANRVLTKAKVGAA